MAKFYNPGPKIWGPLPQNFWAKGAKFGVILDNFQLQLRMSPEWMEISKIGDVIDSDYSPVPCQPLEAY